MHLVAYGYLSLLCARFVLAISCTDVTISSQSDADDLAQCETISGDVNLSDVTGDITLSGVTQITGSLNSSLAVGLVSLTASSLEAINGSLNIVASIKITTLSLPSLTSIGNLVFNAVPYLNDIEVGGEGLTSVGNVSIINTGLMQIDWLNMSTVEKFVLKNNQDLKALSLDALQSFTGDFDISGNYADLAVTFPNVTSGNSISISDLSSVEMSSLQHLVGNLELSGDNMSAISLPELVNASSVSISDNLNLETVDMSSLVTIEGDLSITSNDNLSDISLPSLEAVSGNVTIIGAISSISLPAVEYIGGTLSVNVSSTDLDCDAIKTSNYATSSQEFVCSINKTSSDNGTSSVSTGSTNTSATASSSSSSASGHSSGSLSSAAKAGIGAGIGVGIPLIVGIALLFIVVRRRRSRRLNAQAGLSPNSGVEQQPDAGIANRFEAPGSKSEMTSELEAGAKDRDLPELGAPVAFDKIPLERQELAA